MVHEGEVAEEPSTAAKMRRCVCVYTTKRCLAINLPVGNTRTVNFLSGAHHASSYCFSRIRQSVAEQAETGVQQRGQQIGCTSTPS